MKVQFTERVVDIDGSLFYKARFLTGGNDVRKNKVYEVREERRTVAQNNLLWAFCRWLYPRVNAETGMDFTAESLYEYFKDHLKVKSFADYGRKEFSELIQFQLEPHVSIDMGVPTAEFWKEYNHESN